MNRSSTRRAVQVALLAAAMVAIAWGALAFGAVYPWAFTPLALGCAAIGIGALVLGGRPPIGALGAGLTAIAIAISVQLVPMQPSTLARVSPAADAFLKQYNFSYGTATHPTSIEPGHTVLGLGLFAAFALFFLGLTRLLSTRGALAMVRPLVAFGVALALIGVVQQTLWGDTPTYVRKVYGFWQPRYRGDPFGPFINRNHFAGWMTMVLPLALAGAYAAWERGKATTGAGFRGGVSWASSPSAAGVFLMAFAGVVMGLSLLLSQSRSGMAAFGAGTVLLGAMIVRHQATGRAKLLTAATIGVIVIAAAGWAGLDLIARRVSTVSSDIATAGGRVHAWSDTVQIIRDFAVLGTGLNTYGTAMNVYQTGDRVLHFQEAHNDYLQLAAEGGLLIGIPLAVTVLIFIRDVRRRFKEAPSSGTTYWLRVGAVVGLVSIGVQSLVEFSLQMPGNAALFATLAAIAIHQSPNLRLSGPHEVSAVRTGHTI